MVGVADVVGVGDVVGVSGANWVTLGANGAVWRLAAQSSLTMGVPGRVGVEADEVTRVVYAIDRGGAQALRGIHDFEPGVPGPRETERLGVSAASDRVRTDDFTRIVDAERLGRRGAREGQRGEPAVRAEQECLGNAAGTGEETGDVAVVVYGGRGQACSAPYPDRTEPVPGNAVGVPVVIALGVGVEAHRDAPVVHAEKLVDRRAGVVSRGEVDAVEMAAPGVEAEVVVHLAGGVLVRPEADRHAEVVESGDLGLERTREVLVLVRRPVP